MDQTLIEIGKNEPSFLYPVVPDEALQDQDRLVTSYRRALGRERIWIGAAGLGAVLLLWQYVRGQKSPSRRRRRSS